MAEVRDGLPGKCALRRFELPLVSVQPPKDLPEVIHMSFEAWAVDKYVIEEDQHKAAR